MIGSKAEHFDEKEFGGKIGLANPVSEIYLFFALSPIVKSNFAVLQEAMVF